MNGLLVVNHFLHSDKFDELAFYFQKAAKAFEIKLETVTNVSIAEALSRRFHKVDFVLFWDKDILLAEWLVQQKIPVFNSALAIETCDDKGKTWLALKKAGLPVPETIPAPMTYANIGYGEISFADEIVKRLPGNFPFVIKESFGSFGQQVYLIKNRTELMKKVKELEGKPFLFQEYIAESKGRDIRLQVVGKKVVASMYRYSENDFRANITNGGHMKAYEPTEEEIELAVRATEAVGADFAGVDLLFGKEGPLVCEVNSNAHFVNIMECTGVDTSVEIMRYIKEMIGT